MNFMNIIPKPQKITFSGKYVPKGSVNESVDADMGKEEYSLNINRDGVFLKGGSERALHYADITYKQILREDGNMLPECEITDKPVFSYRGGNAQIQLFSFPSFRRSGLQSRNKKAPGAFLGRR